MREPASSSSRPPQLNARASVVTGTKCRCKIESSRSIGLAPALPPLHMCIFVLICRLVYRRLFLFFHFPFYVQFMFSVLSCCPGYRAPLGICIQASRCRHGGHPGWKREPSPSSRPSRLNARAFIVIWAKLKGQQAERSKFMSQSSRSTQEHHSASHPFLPLGPLHLNVRASSVTGPNGGLKSRGAGP